MRIIKTFRFICVIVLLMTGTGVSAYDFTVDGIFYNIVSFGDLTCVVVAGDKKYTGDVVVPGTVTYNKRTLTVTSIESNAFYNCSGLTSITIPNSVTSIGISAFYGCSGLTSITIPNSVISINESTFSGCSGLTSITIPSSVTSIGYYAFRYCSGLTSITIPNSVTSIGKGAFSGCSGLTSITIPNSVTSINKLTFAGCSGLTSITIPNSVTSIGDYAFNSCSKIEKLIIEDGTETLNMGHYSYKSSGLFGDCPLKTLYLGRNLSCQEEGYSYSPFYYQSTLTEITIGNTVTSIGNYAFYNCSGLTSITIPNSVTSINKSAFYGSAIEKLIIEDGTKTLKMEYDSFNRSGPFYGCPLKTLYLGRNLSYETTLYNAPFYKKSTLTNVTIGNDVTLINRYLFSDCSGLTTLYSLNPIPPTIGADNFTNSQYLNLNVYVPQDALATYQAADTWKNFWNLQGFAPTGIKTIKADGKNAADTYYDIQGRRLNEPKNGLNIINGKKVLIRK